MTLQKPSILISMLTAIILSTTTFYMTTTIAGVVNTELSAMTKQTKISIDTTNASRLRCWQKGSLLFDELELDSFSVANRKNVISFSSTKVTKHSLHLIDLGETICFFKKIEN